MHSVRRSSEVVLGISHSHDAGAALLVDGQIACAVNEERFTRKKQQMGFPRRSIEAVFELTVCSPADVDTVAIAGTHLASSPAMNNDMSEEDGSYRGMVGLAEGISRLPGGEWLLTGGPSVRSYRALQDLLGRRVLPGYRRELADLGIAAPIRLFDHHECHLAGAYFCSGEDDCLVISNDGFGDGLCSKIALGRGGRLLPLQWNSFHNSLGILYGYATDICGFKRIHHAGKTTGLAARGDWRETVEIFRQCMGWNPRAGKYENRIGLFRIAQETLRARLKGYSREDVAAGIQKLTEELILEQLKFFRRQTGAAHVACSGGVHANVRANQVLAEDEGLKSFFVFPNMGDGGLALGAALLARADQVDGYRPFRLDHVYFGPSWTESDLGELLRQKGVPFEKPVDLARQVADRLAADAIVARFDGAMEYGPRALGNRSILYAATDPTANDWLNKQLGRSEFMPFAPVIREEDAPEMIEGYGSVTAYTAQFMTVTYNASARCMEQGPACVHVDGTLRPQIVRRDSNPGYHDILTEFRKATGNSVLVNTSFNMHEEPIVCSPDDALRAFALSHIDNLVLGPFLVSQAASDRRVRR